MPDTKMRTARPGTKKASLAHIETLDEKIYLESQRAVLHATQYADLDPGEDLVPLEWVKELGYKEAMRKFRHCKAAAQPASLAPYGLTAAMTVWKTQQNAKAAASAQPVLNVVVNMPAPPPPGTYKYDEIVETSIVGDDDES